MKTAKPTPKNAIMSFCHQCMGYWSDGVVDCENYRCPLYRWQPRADKPKADLEWTKYNPKRKGKITWGDCTREMSDEQRAEAAARLRDARCIPQKPCDDLDDLGDLDDDDLDDLE